MAKRNYNGEGSVSYHKALDRYIAQFTDPITKKRKAVYARTEKEAKKKLREALNKAENGIYCDRNNITIPEIATNILESKHEANITSDSTYARAKRTCKIIAESSIGDIPIQSVTKEDIQSFYGTLTGYSDSYIRKVHEMLKKAFETAMVDEIIVKNPMLSILKPKSKKATKVVEALTVEQHKAFISALDKEHYKNIFLIAINTGMRCGEILALQKDDIDFKNNKIHVSKTITRTETDNFTLKQGTKTYAGLRDIPFDNELKSVLQDSINNMTDNSYNVIFSYNNDLIRTNTLNTVFKRICRNLDFDGDYNFHMLRHTFATRCIESGMPAHVLQKLLGHTDVSVTINTYTSIFDRYKQEEFDKYTQYKKANNL